jgi:hypothetical protein
MSDGNADSTEELGEVDRQWERTTLDHPEDERAIDVSGAIPESDDQLTSDLAEADEIAARLRAE